MKQAEVKERLCDWAIGVGPSASMPRSGSKSRVCAWLLLTGGDGGGVKRGGDGGNRAPPGVDEGGDLTEVLRERLGVKEMPTMAVMMPGMGIGD